MENTQPIVVNEDSLHKFDPMVEQQVVHDLVDNEFEISKSNNDARNQDFMDFVDMFDAIRDQRDYQWMSDIYIPEFAIHILAQSAIEASQYFQTRDFVETYIEDSDPTAIAAAEAQKELINRTLNQRHLHYYLKYVRARMIADLCGSVYLKCWWERKTRKVKVQEMATVAVTDETGQPVLDEAGEPEVREVSQEVERHELVYDRFNFDVIDPRNVFTDNRYVYSLQDKDYVYIRSEKKLSDLRAEQELAGYFNLDLLESVLRPPEETETSRETYNKETRETKPANRLNDPFDILERFGKYWMIVEDRDPRTNHPKTVSPGVDFNGQILDGAEMVEGIITFAKTAGRAVMIRFQATPFQDADGEPYRSLIRGLCYVHPVDDAGAGDGKYAREIQTGINETFNISNDRVRLATLPTLKKKKYTTDDNADVYIQPGHSISLEDTKDVEELVIRDNITGALQQISMLTGKMDSAMSIFPTTQGLLPEDSSTTATAVAETAANSDVRTNFKSLTFEHTALADLYWMITQMTWAHSNGTTAQKLMGDKIADFNPTLNYSYKPVSQSIESESSKAQKIKILDSILQKVIALVGIHPDAPKVVNMVMAKIMEYLGDEFKKYGDYLLDAQKPVAQQGGVGSQPAQAVTTPATNQSGVAQPGVEQYARERANG